MFDSIDVYTGPEERTTVTETETSKKTQKATLKYLPFFSSVAVSPGSCCGGPPCPPSKTSQAGDRGVNVDTPKQEKGGRGRGGHGGETLREAQGGHRSRRWFRSRSAVYFLQEECRFDGVRGRAAEERDGKGGRGGSRVGARICKEKTATFVRVVLEGP